jgi:hypothetical protein
MTVAANHFNLHGEAKPVSAPLFNGECISFVKEHNEHTSFCTFTIFVSDDFIKNCFSNTFMSRIEPSEWEEVTCLKQSEI